MYLAGVLCMPEIRRMTNAMPPAAMLAPDTARKLRDLTVRWTNAGAAERANYQLYLIELAEAIGVERPRPAAGAGRVAEGTDYQFEFAVQTTTRDGTISTNFIDLYKAGCFALEAKDAEEGASTSKLLTKAFGQVANYAKDLTERPPYIMVLDVGTSVACDGSGRNVRLSQVAALQRALFC